MPLDATVALVTLAQVEEWLDRADGGVDQDETDDVKLEFLVHAYSRAASRYCEREFVPPVTPDADFSRSFEYHGDGMLDLAPYELRGTPTSVTTKTGSAAASALVLDEGFVRKPVGGTTEGTFLWLELARATRSAHVGTPPRGAIITVMGRWGMLTVPHDVQAAVLIAIENAFRNPGGFGSVSDGGLAISEDFGEPSESGATGMSLPPDARALLGPYRRTPRIGGA